MSESKRRAGEISNLKRQSEGDRLKRIARSRQHLQDQRNAAFIAMRNHVLTLAPEYPILMERFLIFWNNPTPYPLRQPNVYIAMAHTSRLQIRTFNAAMKKESAEWLTENGYSLPKGIQLVDGVVLGAEYDN